MGQGRGAAARGSAWHKGWAGLGGGVKDFTDNLDSLCCSSLTEFMAPSRQNDEGELHDLSGLYSKVM